MVSIYESFSESLNERAPHFKDYLTHKGVNFHMTSVLVYLLTY